MEHELRRLGARRAYTRIDDPAIIALAEALVPHFAPEALLFDGSYTALRNVFDAICRELDLPCGGGDGFTLGSLRPGGATWLYRMTDNSELVRFRGRWASLRMLEVYIQEVGATSVLPNLPDKVRARLKLLAEYAPQEIASFVSHVTGFNA